MYDLSKGDVERMTAKELRAALAGLPGRAVDAIVRETAHLRHWRRVELAAATARAYVRESGGDDAPEEGSLLWQILTLKAAGLLAADGLGIGGRDGVEGLSTSRHPGLTSLGRGRKLAGDGPAWTAAIEEAAVRLLGAVDEATGAEHAWEFAPVLDEDGLGIGIELRSSTWGGGTNLLLDRAWALTIAREGLRRSVGLDRWFDLDNYRWGRWVRIAKSAEGWGVVVETLAAPECGEDETLPARHFLEGHSACCEGCLESPGGERSTEGHPDCFLPSEEEVSEYEAGKIIPVLNGRYGMGWRWETA